MKMPTHRFAIGQSVRLKRTFGLSPTTAETYRVTGRMPARDNSPQYRIRNDDERHERVSTEDRLEEIPTPFQDGAGSPPKEIQ